MSKQEAAIKFVEDASYKEALGYYGKYSRMSKMGFELMQESVVAKETAMQYAFFNSSRGSSLGKIKLPKKVIQGDVDKEQVISLIKFRGKLPPIKVAIYRGEYVVVDGHHRLAAAKALGDRTIDAVLIEDNKKVKSFREFLEDRS